MNLITHVYVMPKNELSFTHTLPYYHDMVLRQGENFTFQNSILWQKNKMANNSDDYTKSKKWIKKF